MLRRQALFTLAGTLALGPFAAASSQPASSLTRQLQHCLQLLRSHSTSDYAAAAHSETVALLQHAAGISAADLPGNPAFWQACSDAVARTATRLPQQSSVVQSLQQLQQSLTLCVQHSL
ncbi:MAG TPA: hypothetical protein DIT89_08300 [Planctomycetaceae bacterium]|nr:hypothetical protein [Planctomycetaceae bacterium]